MNVFNFDSKEKYSYINFSPDESVYEENRSRQGCPTVCNRKFSFGHIRTVPLCPTKKDLRKEGLLSFSCVSLFHYYLIGFKCQIFSL